MGRLAVWGTHPEWLPRGPPTSGKPAMLPCIPQVLLALFLSLPTAQGEGKEFGGEGNSKLGCGGRPQVSKG